MPTVRDIAGKYSVSRRAVYDWLDYGLAADASLPEVDQWLRDNCKGPYGRGRANSRPVPQPRGEEDLIRLDALLPLWAIVSARLTEVLAPLAEQLDGMLPDGVAGDDRAAFRKRLDAWSETALQIASGRECPVPHPGDLVAGAEELGEDLDHLARWATEALPKSVIPAQREQFQRQAKTLLTGVAQTCSEAESEFAREVKAASRHVLPNDIL